MRQLGDLLAGVDVEEVRRARVVLRIAVVSRADDGDVPAHVDRPAELVVLVPVQGHQALKLLARAHIEDVRLAGIFVCEAPVGTDDGDVGVDRHRPAERIAWPDVRACQRMNRRAGGDVDDVGGAVVVLVVEIDAGGTDDGDVAIDGHRRAELVVGVVPHELLELVPQVGVGVRRDGGTGTAGGFDQPFHV